MCKNRYSKATKKCSIVQKKAFAQFNSKLKSKLAECKGTDKEFWRLTKEIGGLSQQRHPATPDVQDLADHFAEKMSNGKGCYDCDWEPKPDSKVVAMVSFKIRYSKVLSVLAGLNTDKSVYGINAQLLKHCAKVIAPAVCNLFKYIVNQSTFPSRWKVGRVTSVHKRGKVTDPTKYRPVQSLERLEMCFEECTQDELKKWINHFVPESQYGFVQGSGTGDYGAMLAFKMHCTLERRRRGIFCSFDVKGAFDRVWWEMLIKKLWKRGMRRRALKLLKHYLFKRFLRVVAQGKSSTKKEIFSSVPQGAKWSTDLYNFDCADMEDEIENGELFSYADDTGVWYEVTDENEGYILGLIQEDLDRLWDWGVRNKTTFEADKTGCLVVSNKLFPFDTSALRFGGEPMELLESIKIVGFVFDRRMLWSEMVAKQAKKARARLAALFRLKSFLDTDNLKTMYTSFIRSISEFGSIGYMAASDVHLAKLDRIQSTAERVCGFEVESLQQRREVCVLSLVLKMMGGSARGALADFAPVTIEVAEPKRARKCKKTGISAGLQLKKTISKGSLKSFTRCAIGQAHHIWSKLPQKLILEGRDKGWERIKNRCKMHLLGKTTKRKQKIVEGDLELIPDNYSCKLNNELGGMVA